MSKGYIEFIGLKIFEKDIQKVRIKKDTDKELYEKGWGYLHSHEYKHLCQGIKCLRLIEKYYPNSEYIFMFYKRIQQCNKYLTKIA